MEQVFSGFMEEKSFDLCLERVVEIKQKGERFWTVEGVKKTCRREYMWFILVHGVDQSGWIFLGN